MDREGRIVVTAGFSSLQDYADPAADRDDAAAVWAIGVDVGGTKCAAGVVALPEGRVLARRLQPTGAERDGEAVLADVIRVVESLQEEASRGGFTPATIGIGVAELVDVEGQIVSNSTIRWQGIPVAARVSAATLLPTRVDADVRTAARAEARLGAGRGLGDFLYVTVGTGISCALVIDGCPYLGARGLTGTFASGPGMIPGDQGELATGPSLERFASGPALSARLAATKPGFGGTAADVLALAEQGDEPARAIVASAACALGAAVAQLVNVLDPAAVVLGGGLGLTTGLYRASLDEALRRHVWSDRHCDLPVLSARLGNDAGWIGAALAAVPSRHVQT
jgi:glucokinase